MRFGFTLGLLDTSPDRVRAQTRGHPSGGVTLETFEPSDPFAQRGPAAAEARPLQKKPAERRQPRLALNRGLGKKRRMARVLRFG